MGGQKGYTIMIDYLSGVPEQCFVLRHSGGNHCTGYNVLFSKGQVKRGDFNAIKINFDISG